MNKMSWWNLISLITMIFIMAYNEVSGHTDGLIFAGFIYIGLILMQDRSKENIINIYK